MTFKEFLILNTSGKNGAPVYIEAQIWLREGWTFERVMNEWQRGDDLLWLLEGMGLITRDEATKLACTCVDRCGVMAPEVLAVSDAVRKGELTSAAFGACCIMGNAEARDDAQTDIGVAGDGVKTYIVFDGPTSELQSYPGADKARYAATLLLDDSRPYLAMSHSVQAKVHEARDAWVQSLKNGCKAEIQELEAAIPKVEAAERLAQADIIREYTRGMK